MNSALTQIYKMLTPEEQMPPDRQPYYVMRLRFKLRILSPQEDLIPNTMGIQESTIMNEEETYRTTKVTRFIPDSGTISEYVKALKIAFNDNPKRKTKLLSLEFDGYDYLYAVMPKEESEGIPTKEALSGLIEYAFLNKVIRIVPDPNGDGIHEPVMSVGDDWVYFDSEDKDVRNLTPLAYEARHDAGYIIRNMTDAVWDLYQTDPESPRVGCIFAYLYETIERPMPITKEPMTKKTHDGSSHRSKRYGKEVDRT